MFEKFVTISLIFLFVSSSLAQQSVHYLFEKDFDAIEESYPAIGYVNHRPTFELDSIDYLNQVKRYVCIVDESSALTLKPVSSLKKSFSVEVIFKPAKEQGLGDLFQLVGTQKNSSFIPSPAIQFSEHKYQYVLLTRNYESAVVDMYLNGELVKRFHDKERAQIEIAEIVIFSPNTKATKRSVAYLKLTDKHLDSVAVIQSMAEVKNYFKSLKPHENHSKEVLKVDFKNASTGEPMKANLTVLNGKRQLFHSATAQHSFEIDHIHAIDYQLIARAEQPGYMTSVETVSISEIPAYKSMAIAPVAVGQTFQFKTIQFKKSSTIMLDGSKDELDRLIVVLMDNPKMEILIGGHSDHVGNDELNFDLSLMRARVVEEYLVEHGIARERLTSQGFGGTKPLVDNLTEANRQINRRVEFTILKM